MSARVARLVLAALSAFYHSEGREGARSAAVLWPALMRLRGR
jgi:hypothetical protein